MKKILLCLTMCFILLIQMFSINVSADVTGTDMDGHWAKDYGVRLLNLGIMNGYEDGTFKLGGTITRAEFVKLLVTLRYGNYRTYTEEFFSDVFEDKWYFNYICAASEEGILEEEEGEEFRPSDLITREEMVVMIVNSLELSGGSSYFDDVKKSNKHYNEISAAVNSGIIQGYDDGLFRPDNTATRGETAAMVCRILNYITDKELIREPDPFVELEEDEYPEGEEPEIPDVEYVPGDVDTGVDGKINLTWHQIYNTGVTKTGDHMAGLNVISPTWFRLVDNTGLTPYSYEHEFYSDLNLYIADLGNKEYIKDAKMEGYKVWAMFNTEGSQAKASKFLNNSSARAACVKMMKDFILKYDLDGINLDFENMYQSDRDVYTQFVKEMAEMCHSVGAILSVDVTKYEATSPTYSLCYDRAAIAKYADYVALMAYDQNGTWSTTAGSVADLDWTEKAVIKTLEEVPNEKLLLGIPFYARIWETSQSGKVIKTSAVGMSTVAKRIAENGATVYYDNKTGQNYAQWSSGGNIFKVWIEDKTSIKARLDLVEKYDLAGVASWSKTFETPDIWEFIEENLQ
ncbi:MAG: S-layer homology domain-containing protein [Clostridia bacterium]|nr:S-layer homology domain-containing protein [Clostridia bacterium]